MKLVFMNKLVLLLLVELSDPVSELLLVLLANNVRLLLEDETATLLLNSLFDLLKRLLHQSKTLLLPGGRGRDDVERGSN